MSTRFSRTRSVTHTSCLIPHYWDSFAHDLGPRELPHGHHLLVDLDLRRFVAEHASQVVDFGRHEAIVLRQEAGRGVLEIAFGDGDELVGTNQNLLAHEKGNEQSLRS